MKTPGILLLALVAAVPSSAAEPAHHCDVAWLADAAKVPASGVPAAKENYLKDEDWQGGKRKVVDSASKVCDNTVWRFLYNDAGGAWYDAGSKQAWDSGWPQQVRLLQASDELYAKTEPLGRAVLDKADALVDAAVKLGVSAKKDGAGVDALVAKGRASAAFAKDKAYTVEAPSAAPATAPADMKAALSALLKDPAAPKAQKGKAPPKPGAPVLGPAVLEFRAAVLDLAADIAVRQGKRDLVQKFGVDASVKSDFPFAGLGWAVYAKGLRNGAASYDEKILQDDKAFKGALAYLTDAKIAAGDDVGAYEGAALSRLDWGLRNLLASRAAAVDAAVAATRKRLNGATVKSALAQVDRDAKGGPKAPDAKASGLSAEVMTKLQGAKDFTDLNALFEARSKAAAADPNSPAAKWMASPQGQEAKAKLDAMRADAKATAVAGDQLQYSVGGTKLSAPVRVPGLQNAQYRGAVADAVVTAILKGNGYSAELAAALAAFRNDPAAPPLLPAESALAPKLPLPPGEQVGGSPRVSAWSQIAQATAEPGWFSSYQGRIQKYQDEERERAAAEAAAASTKRREVQSAADAARAAETRKCEQEKKDISRREADPLWKPEVAAKWRSDLLAAKGKECEGRIQGAFDKVVADAKLTDPVAVDEARKKRIAAADALVKQAYVDGILASVDELHKEYRDDKSDRARKAASESKFYTFYGKHLDLVDGYFKKTWEDKKDESVGACQGLLWHPAKGEDVAAEFKDPTRENVDGRCVHKGLVLHLSGYIGTGDKAE